MKNGWQTKKLGELLEIQNGYAFSSQDYSASGHFVMRIGNVQNGYVSLTDPKFIQLPADGSLQRFVLSEDDILVSLTGNVGRVGVIKKEHLPAALNQRVARISIRKDSPAIRELLLFFLFSDWFREELIGAGHGAAQQNVSTKDIVEIQIPIPPLAEQQRIVGVLDEAFAGLATAQANAEKNLQNARALFASYHNSIFARQREGWTEKSLGEVCEYVNGKAHEQCIDKDGQFIVINSKFISTEGEILKRSNDALLLLQPGDIAMVLSDVPNGKALAKCFLVEEANTYTLNQRICLLRSINFHTKFLFYQLNRNRHFLSFDNGENQTNLRLNQVLSCPLFLPPLAEQEIIAAKLDDLSEETQRLGTLYERKLAALAALKKSLLNEAFTGQLTIDNG